MCYLYRLQNKHHTKLNKLSISNCHKVSAGHLMWTCFISRLSIKLNSKFRPIWTLGLEDPAGDPLTGNTTRLLLQTEAQTLVLDVKCHKNVRILTVCVSVWMSCQSTSHTLPALHRHVVWLWRINRDGMIYVCVYCRLYKLTSLQDVNIKQFSVRQKRL